MPASMTSNKVVGGALMLGGIFLVYVGYKHFRG